MQIAQINIGRLLAPTDDPQVKDFMDNLDRINGLGKRMPGFVWMMEGSGAPGTGNTDAKIDGDPQFVANLTVWETPAALRKFVFDTLHARFMTRKSEWFEVMRQQHFAMWWIDSGHKPTLNEGLAKIAALEKDGDTKDVFGWDAMKTQYPA